MKRSTRTGFTLVELLVVIGIIALLISILLPSLNRARETANKVKCASNLKQIGTALLLYANENRGKYPRTYVSAGAAAITPTWGTPYTAGTVTGNSSADPFLSPGNATPGSPSSGDVSGALFLLLRTQDLVPEVFTCPSGPAEKWDYGAAGQSAQYWGNWPGAADVKKWVSYSYQNPYPNATALSSGFKLDNTLTAEFAIMSDMNPGIVGGDDTAFDKVQSTSSAKDTRPGNSNNHDGDGQNVLFGDGHVDFLQNPYVGVQRDHIFFARTQSANMTEQPTAGNATLAKMSPFDANDNVLLPWDD
jgi:prepilin-type N-terminal cleavage/methylation domain-containing protein/prepilin-type processing-associated H-X9-DG protein